MFVKTDNFTLQFVQIGALEVVLLVLLFEQEQVLLNLFLLGQIKLSLHAGKGLNLSVLSDLTLKLLVFDALSQHGDLVLVEVLNAVDHHFLLSPLLGLIGSKGLFLVQKLVLFKVGGESVYLLAETHLLSISLVHETFLLVDQLFFEFLLSDLFELHLTLDLAFNPLLLQLLALVLGSLLVRILLNKGLILPLLPANAIHGLFVLCNLLVGLLLWRVR